MTIEASLLFDVGKVENQKNCVVSVLYTRNVARTFACLERFKNKMLALTSGGLIHPVARFVIYRVHNIKN